MGGRLGGNGQLPKYHTEVPKKKNGATLGRESHTNHGEKKTKGMTEGGDK